MTEPELSRSERQLLDVLPADGTGAGNTRTRQSLGWPEDKYWKTRDALLDKGLVARGRGQGGSLRRMPVTPVVEVVAVPIDGSGKDVKQAARTAVEREEALYEPLVEVLKKAWARERGANHLAVELTARQGARQTGGRWSRPDIVSVEVKTYEYVPGKFLEVVTFEVKPADTIDVQAVYEALAHRRAATKCYVMLHVPAELRGGLELILNEVIAVAQTHGVGVVTFSDATDYDTWDVVVEAQRFEPDPERLNDFVDTQLPAKTKAAIARALR